MRFLLLSRLLRKVVTIVLKIVVMSMYHSRKFSLELGWVAQHLEVPNAAAENAGTSSHEVPCQYLSSSHPSPRQIIWTNLS